MTHSSDLLRQGKLKRGRFSTRQVRACLGLARRDIAAATLIGATSSEWALNIAYNAMLQAGRALMFSAGFRTASEGHHMTTVQFLQDQFGEEGMELLSTMDRLRRRRNQVTYDFAGTVTAEEVQEAIAAAKRLLGMVEREVAALQVKKPHGK